MLTCSGLKDDPNPKYSTCRCRNEYLITSKYLVNNLSSRTRPFIKQIEWKFWRTIILLSLLKIRPDRFTVLGVKASSKEFWVQSIQYTCLLLMPTLRFLAALSSIFMLYKELRNKMPEQSPLQHEITALTAWTFFECWFYFKRNYHHYRYYPQVEVSYLVLVKQVLINPR